MTELKRLRTDGLLKGDHDLKILIFLNEYLSSHNKAGFKVPNLIHYIWFSCHVFKIPASLCMLSSYEDFEQKPKTNPKHKRKEI